MDEREIEGEAAEKKKRTEELKDKLMRTIN